MTQFILGICLGSLLTITVVGAQQPLYNENTLNDFPWLSWQYQELLSDYDELQHQQLQQLLQQEPCP